MIPSDNSKIIQIVAQQYLRRCINKISYMKANPKQRDKQLKQKDREYRAFEANTFKPVIIFCDLMECRIKLGMDLNTSSLQPISIKQCAERMKKISPGQIIKDYSVISLIGKGRYGLVYHCVHNTKKEPVAIKQSLLNIEVQGICPLTLREISTLYQLKNENIVNLITNFMGPNCMFLVFQLLDTDLQRYLEQSQPMQLSTIKMFLFQILRALEFCHTRRVIHRDVKPGNIFLSKQGKLKLGDFGLSRTFTYPLRPFSEEVVTLWYRAPEILLGHQFYGPEIDVWSAGCIFGQMIFGKPMFAAENQIGQLNKIFEIMGCPKTEYWPQILQMKNYHQLTNKYTNQIFRQQLESCKIESQGKDLLRKLLQLNPRRRITAKEALLHSYFAGMHK